ncbi:MAG: MoaD/ThiS family protein [Desulfurococcales archaeon]|nr:MoaD/ThiS family protein [Desulfurococcales archaeon]
MRVIVKYFGYLSEYAGGREQVVDAAEGSRIRDVIKLPPDVSVEDLVILRNGRPAKPDEEVQEGDIISVLPHISGGQPG